MWMCFVPVQFANNNKVLLAPMNHTSHCARSSTNGKQTTMMTTIGNFSKILYTVYQKNVACENHVQIIMNPKNKNKNQNDYQIVLCVYVCVCWLCIQLTACLRINLGNSCQIHVLGPNSYDVNCK